MKWTGMSSVPETTAALGQFLQAVKNNLDQIKQAADSGEFAGSSTTVNNTTITGSGSGNAPPSLADFGTITGDGVTDNDVAFAAAEASAFDEIYVPSGIYKSAARAESQFTKGYWGPGLILLSDGTCMPGTMSYIASPPTIFATQGRSGFFRGETKFQRPQWFTVGPNTRKQLDYNRYYSSPFIPHATWSYVYDGGSGLDGRLASAAAAGATAITVTGADPTWAGKKIGFLANTAGAITDIKTITSVVGTTVNLNAGLASPLPAGYGVTLTYRTASPVDYTFQRNYAPGDAVVHVMRSEQRYAPNAGQLHWFETSTAGLYGGDISFIAGSSGTAAEGIEIDILDQSNDVAAIAARWFMGRENDTGAKGVVWFGEYITSGGSKPCDAGIVIDGKWRIGLDLASADFSNYYTAGDQGQCAIALAMGQKIYFDQARDATLRGGDTSGNYGLLWSNKLGDLCMGGGQDGSGDFWAVQFLRAAPNDARIRLRPQSVQINKQLQVAGDINGAANLSLGASGLIAFGAGSGNYIIYNTGLGRLDVYAGGVLAGHVP